MQRILVVEDDFDIQELLQNFLQEAGYEVAVANDGVEALSLFAGERYDLIVLDIMLPKIDGYTCRLVAPFHRKGAQHEYQRRCNLCKTIRRPQGQYQH